MWKHWLGLPSAYYETRGAESTPLTAKGTERETTADPIASGSDSAEKEKEKKKYTKAEIAEAVKTLRRAAFRTFPDDPETALRAALDAAEEGDAWRFARFERESDAEEDIA